MANRAHDSSAVGKPSKPSKTSDYRLEEKEAMHAGPPLDFSFKNATTIDELLHHTVHSHRTRKLPEKTCSHRFFTSTLWLSNNSLAATTKLEELAKNYLEVPGDLRWLDLSYNKLRDIDQDLLKFKNLSILYLHGNEISDIKTILKLQNLPKLRSLTLHGNSVEQMPTYRRYVVAILPQILNLDFSPVLETEKNRPLPTGFFKVIAR